MTDQAAAIAAFEKKAGGGSNGWEVSVRDGPEAVRGCSGGVHSAG